MDRERGGGNEHGQEIGLKRIEAHDVQRRPQQRSQFRALATLPAIMSTDDDQEQTFSRPWRFEEGFRQ